MIEIVKNRPVPVLREGHWSGKAIYPFADMQVGDSFSLVDDGERVSGRSRVRTRIESSAYSYRKRHNLSARFIVRDIDGEVVCWRVA